MAAKRRSGGDSGFAVVFLVLLVVGVIIKFFWRIAGAAALVGAFFATRAIERKRIDAAARDAELTRRADLQHRRTLRGGTKALWSAGLALGVLNNHGFKYLERQLERSAAVRRCRAHPACQEGQRIVRRRGALEHTTQTP